MCIQVPMLNVGYWLRYTLENLYNIFYERAGILSDSLIHVFTFISSQQINYFFLQKVKA